MPFRGLIRFILFFFVSITVKAEDKKNNTRWSLSRCIEYAKANNLNIKQAEIAIKLSELKLQQTKLSQYPTVIFSDIQAIDFGRSIDPGTNLFTDFDLIFNRAQISGSLPLIFSGSIKNLKKAEQFNLDALIIDFKRLTNETAATVASYYFRALLAREQIFLIHSDIEKTKKLQEIIGDAISIGVSTKLNLYRINVKLSLDSSNYIEANTNYKNSIFAIKSLLNLNSNEDFELETPEITEKERREFVELESAEMIYKEAQTNQYKIKIDNLQVMAYEYKIKSSKAALLPTLSLEYNFNSFSANFINDKPFRHWWDGFGNQMQGNFSRLVGLSVNFPLFNSGQYRMEYKRDKINLENIKSQSDIFNSQLKQSVYTAFENALGSFNNISQAEKAVSETEKIYELSLKLFSLGELNAQDILTAQSDLLKAKLTMTNNILDFYLKNKIVQFYKTGEFK